MPTVDGERPYEDRSPVHETHYDTDVSSALSETVVEAIATAKGVDPIDCDLQLYEAVDLEALDTLFDRRAPDSHWRFEFSIEGYLVVVTGDGTVAVFEH